MRPSRAASSVPQRSTAALSVVGDSRRTSASIVSSSQLRSSRQKSRSVIIVDGIMTLPRTFLCVLYSSLCVLVAIAFACVLVANASAQTPQPFPRPGQPPPRPAPTAPAPAAPTSPGSAAAPQVAPTEANLGVPIFPGA